MLMGLECGDEPCSTEDCEEEVRIDAGSNEVKWMAIGLQNFALRIQQNIIDV